MLGFSRHWPARRVPFTALLDANHPSYCAHWRKSCPDDLATSLAPDCAKICAIYSPDALADKTNNSFVQLRIECLLSAIYNQLQKALRCHTCMYESNITGVRFMTHREAVMELRAVGFRAVWADICSQFDCLVCGAYAKTKGRH